MEISTVTKHKITFTVELRDGLELNEQQAGEVTELRAALWHIKNTAISLSDAQVIALEALAAYEAKKAGE